MPENVDTDTAQGCTVAPVNVAHDCPCPPDIDRPRSHALLDGTGALIEKFRRGSDRRRHGGIDWRAGVVLDPRYRVARIERARVAVLDRRRSPEPAHTGGVTGFIAVANVT